MKKLPNLIFSNEILNRRADLRLKSEAHGFLGNEDSLNIVFSNGAPLLGCDDSKSKLAYLSHNHWLLRNVNLSVFLGLYKGKSVYAHNLFNKEGDNRHQDSLEYFKKKIEKDPLMVKNRFGNLRTNFMTIEEDDSALAGTGRSLLEWGLNNKYCGKCGETLNSINWGWEKRCENCCKSFFPRIDPVVIMIIVNGSKTLLGRSHQFPENLFSCLAGFVEPGETIEMAAKREVQEEVGLRISNIQYITNQPWPFPSSLMIGLRAQTNQKVLTIDHNELENAVWVTKTDLKNLLIGNCEHMQVARPGTIARSLLESWAKGLI